MHYVYIIKNSDNIFYKGYSTDPYERLIYHNNGNVKSTKPCLPWELACIIEKPTRSEAMRLEKKLKK